MGVHPESHPLQPDTDDGGVVADEVPRERVRVRVEEAREVEPALWRRHTSGAWRGVYLSGRGAGRKSSATWSTQLSPHLGGGAGRAASSAGSEGGRRGGRRWRQRGRRRRRRRRRGRRRPVRRGYSHREALLPCPSLGPAPALRVCTVHLQATQGCEHGLGGGLVCAVCSSAHERIPLRDMRATIPLNL